MTEVLIVARTRIGGGVCIGGLRLDDSRNVRLMTATGAYQPATSPYTVGEVYEMTLTPEPHLEPPHVENVRVAVARRVRVEPAMVKLLTTRVSIVRSSADRLFEGKLGYTSRDRPYIGRDDLPKGSVEFWEPERPLLWAPEDKRYVYSSSSTGDYVFTYAGVDAPVDEIPPGTLVRISLATWYPGTEPAERQRCYTQVSGWFSR